MTEMTRKDCFQQLIDLIEKSGAIMTLDMRRHSRSSKGWPDHLPPMFPLEELKKEHWVPDNACHWIKGGPVHRLQKFPSCTGR